ncbi:hypothetical protein ABZV78_20480 [Micromonospora sp. NPDC004540]|uniref:hypothetical protein n=1 Tax=Micromonospora sp. NPDC004540 TaxID=3154457 RepID=UPI0033A7252C
MAAGAAADPRRDGPPGNAAWLDRGGLEVAYDLDAGDGRTVPVVWGLRVPQPETGLPEGVDCGSPRLRTCTDLGGGELLIVSHRTGNSSPSTALYRADGGRVRAVEVQGPDPVGSTCSAPRWTGCTGPPTPNRWSCCATRATGPTGADAADSPPCPPGR